ncbi:MAG: hypothetical protein HZA48_04950 [Planctomycetes bacterium]|nr:hypothetical protein [Planctomycetota bacterium]
MLKSIWDRLRSSFPVVLFLIVILLWFCPGIFMHEVAVRELPIPESSRSREENIRFLLSYVKNSNIDSIQMEEYWGQA